MKNNFLKFIVLFLSVFSCGMALSAEKITFNAHNNESYLILLNVPANSVMASDIEILSPEVLTTLYNEKNQVLVRTLASGIARLYISTDERTVIVETSVNSDVSVPCDEFVQPNSEIIKAIIQIDRAYPKKEKTIELDLPPQLRGEH